jgi:uncharacterized membrane protein YhaH (DUF805 family)
MTFGQIILFLLSPFGRITRDNYRPIAILTGFAAFYVFLRWHDYCRYDQTRSILGISIIIGLIVKFAVTSKRLHDVGLSAIFAMPVIGLLALHLFATYWITSIGAPWYIWPWNPSGLFSLTKMDAAVIVTSAIVLGTDIALFFINGSGEPNIFGRRRPGERQPVEVF